MSRSVAEHQTAVRELLGSLAAVPAEEIPLAHAVGRVLATSVLAPLSLPPFANSQMDGYAVRTADLGAEGALLSITDPIAAGYPAEPLANGMVAPIMTGAMIPRGADAVVPIERAVPNWFFPHVPGQEADGNEAARKQVRLPGGIQAAEFIRAVGSDISRGALALAAGTVLGSAQLGLLAALGMPTVGVRRRPSVLLLTTGDEVVQPGGTLKPGQIHDANTTMLAAALGEAGAAIRLGTALTDNVDAFRTTLAEELDAGTGTDSNGAPDLILTSGGISKGAYEVVRQGLADQQVRFLSVALQPGGPQAIGTVRSIPFLGFPGNPVSALLSFEMFLRPALTQWLGVPEPRPVRTARLEQAVAGPEGKHQIRRGRYQRGTVSLLGGPGSHLLHALAASNALVHLPPGTGTLEAGEKVTVWLTGPATESSTND